MTIWICSLEAAPEMAQKLKPSRVVSLLSPYDSFPTFAGLGNDLHLQVAIHDIAADIGDWQAPAQTDAERVIRFVEAWDKAAPMLIHCWAGISRSTASAFITACVHNPSTDEEEIAWAIRNASPTASPNVRLIAHADALLGRGGRMSKAVEAIGRGAVSDEARAFSIPSSYGGPA
ncbi:MAG: protein-tyrosine phosphatase family protein [Hyphomonadaceae bacterium]|nr:protein-tyrosine phosphatase family protein [Hyphomonadaceae bacterium]